MSEFILAYATFSSEDEARKISGHLIGESLIACANIFAPHTSIYRWQGKIEETREVAAILKTRAELFGRVRDEILKLHSYDTPCILKLPVTGGNEDFLSWIAAETGSK